MTKHIYKYCKLIPKTLFKVLGTKSWHSPQLKMNFNLEIPNNKSIIKYRFYQIWQHVFDAVTDKHYDIWIAHLPIVVQYYWEICDSLFHFTTLILKSFNFRQTWEQILWEYHMRLLFPYDHVKWLPIEPLLSPPPEKKNPTLRHFCDGRCLPLNSDDLYHH